MSVSEERKRGSRIALWVQFHRHKEELKMRALWKSVARGRRILHAGGLQNPIRATSIEALLNLPFRGIGAEQEMIRHVPSQQG